MLGREARKDGFAAIDQLHHVQERLARGEKHAIESLEEHARECIAFWTAVRCERAFDARRRRHERGIREDDVVRLLGFEVCDRTEECSVLVR